MNLLSAIVFGMVHGARHTFEPDHLAAVSVLVSNSRGIGRSIRLGALWGLGHTLSLTVVCLALVLIGAKLPASVDVGFNLLVGVLLVALGLRALLAARGEQTWREATHPHAHAHPHRQVRSPVQAFAVGVIHGMASSGAITALAIAGMPTTTTKIGFVVVFGAASTIGMASVSAIAGVTFARIARPWITRILGAMVGATSVAIGIITLADVARQFV